MLRAPQPRNYGLNCVRSGYHRTANRPAVVGFHAPNILIPIEDARLILICYSAAIIEKAPETEG